MKFSIVFLANTNNESVYKMNLDALNSFVISAEKANLEFEIIFIESNVTSNYTYSIKNFIEIKPNLDFNFHKFANIGLRQCSGDYYILSNNDVVFDELWLVELKKTIQNNPHVLSFSPLDKSSNKLSKNVIESQELILGYQIQKHITGWCFIMHKSVYKKIKQLDEKFNFYYADFDYAMQLRQYNILHALVTKSKVQHLEGKSSTKVKKEVFDLPKNTPKYIIRENWTWVLSNKKMIEGLILFHKKWGSRKKVKLKIILGNYLDRCNLGFVNRYLFKL
jgi:hypothetical protein